MKTITYKQFQKEFIQFLIDNKALKPYLKAFRQQYLSTKYLPTTEKELLIGYINPLETNKIKGKIKSRGPRAIIDFSFTWSKTNEGHKFWSKLDAMWYNKMIGINVC